MAPRLAGTYRSVGTLWAAVFSTVGSVGFLILIAAVGRGRTGLYVVVAPMVLAAIRLWMAGIHVGPGGVRVVTLLRSRRVLWCDVDHFAVLPLGRYPYVGYAVLRSGRKYGTFGLSTSAGKTEAHRRQVQRPIDDLNRVLAAWAAADKASTE